jgi:hypothetical protein
MRGNVYRLGRRRAGSVVLATGVAFALAVGGAAPAAARPSSAAAPAKAAIRAAHSQVKLQARPPVMARAAGHKIA